MSGHKLVSLVNVVDFTACKKRQKVALEEQIQAVKSATFTVPRYIDSRVK